MLPPAEFRQPRTDPFRCTSRGLAFAVDLRAGMECLDLAQLLEQRSFEWEPHPPRQARVRTCVIPKPFLAVSRKPPSATSFVHGLLLSRRTSLNARTFIPYMNPRKRTRNSNGASIFYGGIVKRCWKE